MSFPNAEIVADASEQAEVDASPKPPRKKKGGKELAGRSPGRIAMARLVRDKVALLCMVVLGLLVLVAIFNKVISNALNIYPTAETLPYNPSDVLAFTADYTNNLPLQGPPLHGFWAAHPLGLAPGTAVDNLSRLMAGLQNSLEVAAAATIFSTIIGVVIGLVAGFARGWVDRVLMFITDLFLSFPFILGALALSPIIQSRFNAEDLKGLSRAQFYSLIAILVLFGWMSLARLIRGQVLSLREREFVQAARVIGVPTTSILFKELLPNLVAPIIVAVSLSLPAYVTAEAGLSYLGIGLTGRPSLGQTILDAQQWFEVYPLYLWAPVVTIVILVLSLNILGDSVRDAFDPKTRR